MNILAWGLITTFALVSVALLSLYKKTKRKPVCRKDGYNLERTSWRGKWICPKCKSVYTIKES